MIAILLAILVPLTAAQTIDVETLIEDRWYAYPPEERAAILRQALSHEDSRIRAYSLVGVGRLTVQSPREAHAVFNVSDIRPLLDDADEEIVREALHAFRLLSASDAEAEAEIVAVAKQSNGPLEQWEYIRYLRPHGIMSDEARDWLLELAVAPVSAAKFSAVEALVNGLESPPPMLLPHVIELISSNDYFCRSNLVRPIAKFGTDAYPHAETLGALRLKLVEQSVLPAAGRSVTLAEPPQGMLNALDEVLALL